MRPCRRLWQVVAVVSGGAGCVLPLPSPRARSGRVTTVEGKPVVDAEVRVESWDVAMPGSFKETLVHTSIAKTDSDGRWSIAGRATLRFALPVPEMPVIGDELTIQASGMAPLHLGVGFHNDTRRGDEEASALRVSWDGPAPWSVVTLPTFGIAGGAGQKVAAHVGAMMIVGRTAGAGVRGELAAGINAASAAAGIVAIPVRATTPILGIELNGRYLRPWSLDGNRHVEWGTEIGFNFVSWRLTLTALGPGALTPLTQRRIVIGFGWGYF